MNNIKICLLSVLIMFSTQLLSESTTFTDLLQTKLTEVNKQKSLVYINNRAYLYKPDKKNSLYRDVDTDSIDIGDLEPGVEYYFQITLEEKKTATGYSDEPVAIIFISDEHPPE